MNVAPSVTIALAIASIALSPNTDAQTGEETHIAEKGKALLVFCRASALKGAAWGHDYYIDGRHVAKLSSGARTQIGIPPGKFTASTGPKRNPLFRSASLDAEAGRVYYIIDDSGNSFASYEPFRLTDAGTCLERTKKTQPPLMATFE